MAWVLDQTYTLSGKARLCTREPGGKQDEPPQVSHWPSPLLDLAPPVYHYPFQPGLHLYHTGMLAGITRVFL